MPTAGGARSRLQWQCRRGMRELDELLSRFLAERYDGLAADEKLAFEDFLELSDPELLGYLLRHERPESEALARVLVHILERAPA